MATSSSAVEISMILSYTGSSDGTAEGAAVLSADGEGCTLVLLFSDALFPQAERVKSTINDKTVAVIPFINTSFYHLSISITCRSDVSYITSA